ncbi:MAG: hypothetical protein JWQ38_3537 [Flavipsychrobacter sp.]|nr:hypothetical protein [Flavipsychrobacter sp.]
MNKLLFKALRAVILSILPIAGFAQAPILGTAAKFVLFTTNGAMTCSGTKYLNHLTGDVGSNLPGSVTGFGNVDGVMHVFDVATGAAAADVVSLYTQLGATIPTGTLASPFGGGLILAPGVYSIPTAATLTGDLILDAGGDPNAIFIFQIGGVLSTSASSKVKLLNGAMACNVFWQVGGAVNVGTGTFLRGTIVADGQIDLTSTLDTLEGRALAMNAPVLVSQLVSYTPIGCGSPYLTGPLAPALVSTATYGVFSSIGAVTSTPVTYVLGDVGGNSAAPTGFNPLNVTGAIHSMDPSTAAAAGDLTNVYNYLVAMAADINLLDPANLGHDLVLTPHAYQITGITQLTGNLILNAQGNPNAVFVIKINGSFTTGSLSKIILTNGTQAKNVYWKVDGAVNVFSNSVFNGTLVDAGAITLNTGDTLNGRAMTINGAIAINGSYVNTTPATCVGAPITGIQPTCTGSTTTLSDADAGGTWTSSNTLVATIGSSSGVVTGMTPGTTTINYTSPLSCISTTTLTVGTAPLPITGPNTVCEGGTITLSDATPGGTWSSSNTAQATAGSTTGDITGVANGTPTISYTMPDGCFATQTVTVNPSGPGIITGSSSVCVGSSIILTDTTLGGVWSASNTNVAVVSGVVTGIATGTSTISYTISTLCGAGTAIKTVTVGPTLSAGVITGPSNVCVGSSVSLTDATTGGIWSSSNARATVVSGLVTGVSAGAVTISYTVASSCGTASAVKSMTVSTLPVVGVITGPSSVCVASTIALTDLIGGGTWSVSNTNATVSGGTVTGVASGISTISYTVTNACGSTTALKPITVNPLPNAGTITGASVVCVGSTTALTDATTGGVWSSSNTNATVTGGLVMGVATGTATISYTVTNVCGTANALHSMTVNTIPVAGVIAGPSIVCQGATIAMTDAITGGIWSSSNTNATVTGGLVTGVAGGTADISYTVTNTCGTASAVKSITVNPLPNPGVITGTNTVCIGSSITLTNITTGGTWSSSNTNVTVTSGAITGVSAGAATISYAVTNACGTATTTKSITVSALPAIPVIATQSPAATCTGTMYQNFGAATMPPTGISYKWTATNATVWAQGTGHQYALINFTTPGTATVMLNATGTATGCTSQSSVTINVGTGVAHTPQVTYFNNHFVCTPSTEDAYQWGYDNISTLDSTLLTGEINQDYLAISPDFSNKAYWAMTTSGGCIQKTYYKTPTAVQNIATDAAAISVYPNPANSVINVSITTSVTGMIAIEVVNMMGQKISTAQTADNKATIDVAALPAGHYMIACYQNGLRVATAKFIKN